MAGTKGTKGQEDPHSMKESTASGGLDANLTSYSSYFTSSWKNSREAILLWVSSPNVKRTEILKKTPNYLIAMKDIYCSVFQIRKFQKKKAFIGEGLIAGSFVLPCRFGFASLKEESMKLPYTRLSQSTIHKVVTISL